MYDIYDSQTFKEFQWQCKNDDMLIALGCCSDGFPMFKHRTKSITPMFVCILNFPPCLRHKLYFGMRLWTLDDGSDASWQVVCSELRGLWEKGLDYGGKHFRIALITISLDGPAYEKCKKTQGGWSHAGCNECDFPGETSAKARIFYGYRR